jgi:hypothetical protein
MYVYGLKKRCCGGIEKNAVHAFARLLLNSSIASVVLVYILILSLAASKLLTATWLFTWTVFIILFAISFV